MVENPKHTEAAELHQRSVDLWLRGQRSDAITVYRKAVEADPNFGEAWHNLGVILSAVGKQEEGSAAFNRARKLLNPKLRIAATIAFKSATTPDGAPDRPAAAPQG